MLPIANASQSHYPHIEVVPSCFGALSPCMHSSHAEESARQETLVTHTAKLNNVSIDPSTQQLHLLLSSDITMIMGHGLL